MKNRLKEFIPVGLYALVPWALILLVLSRVQDFPRGAYVSIHYILDVALFASAFHLFFRRFPKADVFRTTIAAIVFVVVFDIIFCTFFYTGAFWFLNYVDWIFPAFLITTTVYWIGKVTQ